MDGLRHYTQPRPFHGIQRTSLDQKTVTLLDPVQFAEDLDTAMQIAAHNEKAQGDGRLAEVASRFQPETREAVQFGPDELLAL